ncbi:MAG: hypothetical protein GY827_04745 [Cytophagales bacterium]|nr:hypothetical protein [Cytophagales bacterium]
MTEETQDTRQKEFLHDLGKLLEKHRVELVVEEFDAPTWGPGDFMIVAEFEWDLHKEDDIFVSPITLGAFVDKNVKKDTE